MIQKNPKRCKECNNPIVIPLNITMMGASKFCSILCIRDYNKKDKIVKRPVSNYKPVKQFTPKSPSVKMKKGETQIKEIFDRDSNYLALVRSQPCVACGNLEDNHAHHFGKAGKGIKASDYETVSLCNAHHTGDNYAIHKLGTSKFEEQFKISLKEISTKYLIQYIRLLKQ